MKRIYLTSTAIILGLGAAAYAQTFEERIVQGLEADGYTDIEVEVADGLMTVEAEKDGNELETVYDMATEEVISQDIHADDDEDDEDDDDEDEEDEDEDGEDDDDAEDEDDDDAEDDA